MPKNTKKGKNSKNKSTDEPEQKLRLKNPEEGEEYAVVTAKNGSGRFMVKLNDDSEALGRLCGKFRKGRNKRNNWVDVGTVVMVGLRTWETGEKNKVEIIHVYNDSEARKLRKREDFTVETKRDQLTGEVMDDEEDVAFDFDEI